MSYFWRLCTFCYALTYLFILDCLLYRSDMLPYISTLSPFFTVFPQSAQLSFPQFPSTPHFSLIPFPLSTPPSISPVSLLSAPRTLTWWCPLALWYLRPLVYDWSTYGGAPWCSATEYILWHPWYCTWTHLGRFLEFALFSLLLLHTLGVMRYINLGLKCHITQFQEPYDCLQQTQVFLKMF